MKEVSAETADRILLDCVFGNTRDTRKPEKSAGAGIVLQLEIRMRTFLKTAALPLILSCIVGCTSVTPAAKTDRAVVVKQNESRKCYGFVTAQIPAAKYEPGYRTKDGMYYICPTKIIWGYNPTNGGIFIPDDKSKDQRQAVWISDLGSTRLFKFQPQLRIEYVTR